MTEVLFYHLTESRLEDALPPLLEKSLHRGWRVVVQTGGVERRDALDNHLWTWREASFLPHGLDTEPHAELQPIVLSAGDARPNDASVRFLVDGAEPPELSIYDRVVFMFDGHDEQQVTAARGQWKALREAGHTLTYWQQSGSGRWERRD